jgi:hypothetical protein
MKGDRESGKVKIKRLKMYRKKDTVKSKGERGKSKEQKVTNDIDRNSK